MEGNREEQYRVESPDGEASFKRRPEHLTVVEPRGVGHLEFDVESIHASCSGGLAHRSTAHGE